MLPEKLSETLTMVTPSLVDQGEGNKMGFFAKNHETKFTDTLFYYYYSFILQLLWTVSDVEQSRFVLVPYHQVQFHRQLSTIRNSLIVK